MPKSYAKKTTVIVPSYAKSAASLIALGANELIVCRAGELGPIDLQVSDPETGMIIPAHSVRESMDFIKSIEDPIVKLNLADRIPPFLVGAYNAPSKSAAQYLDEVFSEKNISDKNKLIKLFTETFVSHGYPMDRQFLKENGIWVSKYDDMLEDDVYRLYETYFDYYRKLYENNASRLLLVQTSDSFFVQLGSEERTGGIIKGEERN